MEHFFLANDITDATKQRSILISAMGQKAYKTLRNLVASTKPTDVSFANLVKAMTAHFCPPPSEIVQRFQFNSRVREHGETVSAYVAELRALSEHCNFGETLDLMLRDRLVCGINEPQLQKRLLSEPKLTFQKALELSLAFETANKDSKHLQAVAPQSTGATPVYRTTEKPRQIVRCYRCGKANHKAPDCWFKDAECSSCHKKGHLASVCRSGSGSTQRTFTSSPPRRATANTPANTVILQNPGFEEEYGLFSIQQQTSGTSPAPLTTVLTINGKPLTMEVDTGSAVSIVSESVYSEVLCTESKQIQETNVKLCTYSGEQLPVRGKVSCDVSYSSHTYSLSLIVLATSGPTLLGRDWLQQIQLDWSTLVRINTVLDNSIQHLLHPFEDVFRDDLGTFKGDKVSIHVDPTVPPKFCKARPLPYSMKALVAKQLARLEHLGIIKPVTTSKWAAPIVPILKADRKTIRICGDYKLTTIKASRLEQYPLRFVFIIGWGCHLFKIGHESGLPAV